jgi:hypothetical protein
LPTGNVIIPNTIARTACRLYRGASNTGANTGTNTGTNSGTQVQTGSYRNYIVQDPMGRYACNCTDEIDFNGADICGTSGVASPLACCGICADTQNCQSVTFDSYVYFIFALTWLL